MDGAKALAIPTRFGQRLDVTQKPGEAGKLHWQALDEKGTEFLSVVFALSDFKVFEKRGEVSHFMLQDALRAARALNPDFLDQQESITAVSQLEFHPGWGLGSSSTLIYNLASWAQVDAMQLFFKVLQGSGYDVACAGVENAIVYQLNGQQAAWKEIHFHPPFAEQLHFIYLGKKEVSSVAVKKFLNAPRDPKVVKQISGITEKMIQAGSVSEFCTLMEEHETAVAGATGLQKVKDLHFNDFPGAVKSLGAWGGDFVMALAENENDDCRGYFKEKGFSTVFSFGELVFKP